jgi:hypothetical protein
VSDIKAEMQGTRPTGVDLMVLNSGDTALKPKVDVTLMSAMLSYPTGLQVVRTGDGGLLPGASVRYRALFPPNLKSGAYEVSIALSYGVDSTQVSKLPIIMPPLPKAELAMTILRPVDTTGFFYYTLHNSGLVSLMPAKTGVLSWNGKEIERIRLREATDPSLEPGDDWSGTATSNRLRQVLAPPNGVGTLLHVQLPPGPYTLTLISHTVDGQSVLTSCPLLIAKTPRQTSPAGSIP